jgi:hypothetical protein
MTLKVKGWLLDRIGILNYAFAKRVMKTQKITKDEMLEICQRILSRERNGCKEISLKNQLLSTTIIEVRRAA